jgi:hypothetical protein
MTAETAHTASFLDSIWMRLIALVIAVGGVALFVAANRDVLAGWLSGRDGASSAFEQCLDERMAAVDQLAQEAGYSAKQRQLAEIRAQEFCRNQTGA